MSVRLEGGETALLTSAQSEPFRRMPTISDSRNEHEMKAARSWDVSYSETTLKAARSWHGEETEEELDFRLKFDFQSTMAFWSAIFGLQGSLLFTFGAIFMYPAMLRDQPARQYDALVNWPFMIGAWLFTISLYCIYFLLINKEFSYAQMLESGASFDEITAADVNHDGVIDKAELHAGNFTWETHKALRRKFRLIAMPDMSDVGTWAVLINLFGSLLFNFNTLYAGGMFPEWLPENDAGEHSFSNSQYNAYYVSSGVIGSLCFALAGLLEGEHNNWRSISEGSLARWYLVPGNKAAAPLWMSVLNFWGGLLFALGYAVSWDRYVDTHSSVLIWWCTTPFVVGSIFFFGSYLLTLWMWKSQQFGLGFAKILDNDTSPEGTEVCFTQVTYLFIYTLAASTAYVGISYIGAFYYHADYFNGKFGNGMRDSWILEICFKILFYNVCMFMTSFVHKAPKKAPWNYLNTALGLIAIFGLAVDVFMVATWYDNVKDRSSSL